jgi:hypothetical protein
MKPNTRRPLLSYSHGLKQYLESEAIPFREIPFETVKKNFPEFLMVDEDHWTDEDIFGLGQDFQKYKIARGF